MSKLLVGPWMGEFGWEMMRWQGIIRYYAQDNKFDEVIIGCASGNRVLYQDFATDFIDNTPYHGYPDGWKYNHMNPVFDKEILEKVNPDVYISPTQESTARSKPQNFAKYGVSDPALSYDLLIHPRSTTKNGTGIRNWPEGRWMNLVNSLTELKIGCIGTTNSSYYIPGVADLRDISLDKLVNIMSSSKMVIGPSSGPMHLASLCGLKHLVWTDTKVWSSISGTNRQRYETIWNPFMTDVIVIDQEGWQPSIDTILNVLEEEFDL